MIPIITELRYLLSMANLKEKRQFVTGAKRGYDMRKDAPGVAKALDSASAFVGGLFAGSGKKNTAVASVAQPIASEESLSKFTRSFNEKTGGDIAYRESQAKMKAEAAKAAARLSSGYDSGSFDNVPDDMSHANYQRQKR